MIYYITYILPMLSYYMRQAHRRIENFIPVMLHGDGCIFDLLLISGGIVLFIFYTITGIRLNYPLTKSKHKC